MDGVVRITENGDHHFNYHHPLDQGSSPDRSAMAKLSTEISSSASETTLFSSPAPSTPPLPPSCSSAGGSIAVGAGGVGYIVHRVSKMDTLAGVAIKYGVEVADIKRINGLVTDLQMFAHKSLHIPLPGRHPPSLSLSNGFDNHGLTDYEQTPARRRHSDLFETFQSLKLNSFPHQKVSPAMSSLQGYYGLQPTEQQSSSEGCEMAVYSKGGSHYLEDGPFAKLCSLSNPPLSHHRKSRSLANGLPENGELSGDMAIAETIEGEADKWSEKLFRRRQKSDADFTSHTPEKLLKEDNSSGGGFSATAGKGLALRSKTASRTASGVDAEAGWSNPVPVGLGDSLVVADSFSGVRKSSSTSSLQDQENGSSSSIWPTSKWTLKPDLQAFSSAAIARPIFDGLPKPITGRKNKAALD